MLLWFVVFSALGVHAVFRGAAPDLRLVAAGALVPDVIDGAAFRGAGLLHSLLGAVALLVVGVLGTVGHRARRARVLAIAIGVFAHLVLDGVWADTSVFWWPLGSGGSRRRLPVLQHGVVVGLLEEAIAVAAAISAYQRFRLAHPARRRALLRDGTLGPPSPRR